MKQNIFPNNNKNQAHGLWICYGYKDKFLYKGNYFNQISAGYWIENRNLDKYQIRFYLI